MYCFFKNPTKMAAMFAVIGLLVNGLARSAAAEPAQEAVTIEKAEAVLGKPRGTGQRQYGVAYLKVRSEVPFQILPDQPWCRLKEKNGRTLYPVFPVSDGENSYWSQADRPHKATRLEMLCLFTGKAPLELSFTLPDGQVVKQTLPPQQDLARHQELLREWWNRYTYSVKTRVESAAYPPQIENYLVTMLAERFGLSASDMRNRWSGRSDLDQAFGLLLGAESIRVAMQRDTILENTRRNQQLTKELPDPASPPAITLPTFDKSKVEVEKIAHHVPAECFYIRCGNFKNFQWLRSNLTQWGAMARDITALRGWNYGIRDQLEYQLALKETILSKLFGETLISDVALIGNDPFVRAGASIGIIFEARNSALLKVQLDRLRNDALSADPNAKMTTVKIQGENVSFLSTPDNTIRAFYVVDGDYHLITTSRTVAERFLEAGNNRRSLAKLDEFLYARHLMPIARNDAAFVYLSDSFFRELVSPKYRVEMTRRMQAVAEIELVHLAQLAAKAEGADHETIHQLMQGGFLPANFHIRPDGSHTVMEDDQVFDSLRGARGTFLPVADVDIDEITASELEAYQQFSRFYRRQWERMDPAILALKRLPAEKGRERVSVDVHITPYARRHYESINRNVGEVNSWALVPLKKDLAQATINFGSRAGFLNGQFGFAGMRDLADDKVSFKIEHGRVYETVTPPLYYGLLSQTSLNNEAAKNKDEAFPERSLSSSSLFFYPYDVPNQDEIRKDLKLRKVDTPAQVRVWLNRLAETNLAKIINAHAYLRARRASAGNTRFLHVVDEQLSVDPKTALQVAERILGAEPVCRMGGTYQLIEDQRGFLAWQSSAWDHASYHSIDKVSGSFASPLLKGFHQGELHFRIDRTTLSSHLDVEVNAPKRD